MAVINGIVTTSAREAWPKMFGGLLPFSQIAYFRIGEGGWQDLGGGRERRTPSTAYTNLDLVLDPARALMDQRYSGAESFGYYQKALVGSDFVFESPTILKIRCFLDYGEYNTKGAAGASLVYNVGGLGVAPELWELGVFDSANNMVAYGTFPKQTKDGTKQLENVVRIAF